MLRIKIFILFIYFATVAKAQISEVDSLKNDLQKISNDSLKIIFYCQMSDIYANFRPDSALYFAQLGLSLARESGTKKGESRCLTRVGDIYKTMSEFPKALETHLLSLEISEKINDQVGIAASYNNMAEVYKEQGDLSNALDYYFKTESIFKQMISKLQKEKKVNSVEANQKKIQTYKYYLATTYLNIGDAYERKNILDSSLLFQTQAYNIALDNENNDIIGAILCNLGTIHFRLKHADEALNYFNRSVPYLQIIDDKQFLAITYHEIGKIYQGKDSKDSAMLYARKSLNVAKEGFFQKEVLNAALLLSELFDKKRRPDSAFFYQKIATSVKDSIFSQERARKIDQLNFSEQIRQQDLAEARRKADKERSDSLQYFAISIFIVTFFVAIFLLRRKKTKPKLIEYLGIIGLLLIFEFIALFIHPFIGSWTHHTPVIMLIILVGIAAILTPLHHILTHWVKHKLTIKHAHDHSAQISPLEQNLLSVKQNSFINNYNPGMMLQHTTEEIKKKQKKKKKAKKK